MSPSDLEFLIWCHVRCEPHPRQDAPAIFDVLCRFQSQGIIADAPDENGVLRTTAKGAAWLALILSTPIPQAAWVDPRTGTLVPQP